MPIKVERTLFKIGEGGFAVTLPKAWIRFYDLKPGNKVEIIAGRNLTIRVKAKRVKSKKTQCDLVKKESVLKGDDTETGDNGSQYLPKNL